MFKRTSLLSFLVVLAMGGCGSDSESPDGDVASGGTGGKKPTDSTAAGTSSGARSGAGGAIVPNGAGGAGASISGAGGVVGFSGASGTLTVAGVAGVVSSAGSSGALGLAGASGAKPVGGAAGVSGGISLAGVGAISTQGTILRAGTAGVPGACTGCTISGVCYPEGSANPTNSCQWCAAAVSKTAWTNHDTAPCDDGLFCTGADSCSAGQCTVHAGNACDDKIACNGVETCNETTKTCAAGTSTCAAGQVCDVTAKACVAACTGGCSIGGVCYPEGVANPANPCQWCASATSKTAWSNHDGVACDDGQFCTGADSCSAGQCSVHAGSGCDDKVACNGVETCTEATKRCVAGTTTCTGTQVCDVAANACVGACTGCKIGGVCYPDGVANPANPCQWCAVTTSTTAWSNHNAISCNDGNFCNGSDTCQAGTCTSVAANPCLNGQVCLETQKQCCTTGVEASRTCNTAGNVARTDTCGQAMTVETCVSAANHGSCASGVCGCIQGYTGANCATCVIYADAAATNDNANGKTWANAKKSLQAAIDAAAAGTNKCEVWVKKGTYLPVAGTGSTGRAATIKLANGVAVYGGFAGGEILLSQRNAKGNATVLSGDLGNSGTGDNAYHVVTGVTGATLDGFTIRDGNANGTGTNQSVGGGMYNASASPTVNNCVFSANTATSGGAIYNSGGTPYLANCTFSANTATNGGAIYNTTAPAIVENCTFSSNSATRGGAMYNTSSSPSVTNCVFTGNGNAAAANGGAIFNSSAPAVVKNCTFFDNTATTGRGIYSEVASLPSVSNSILWGTTAGTEIVDSASTSTVTFSDVRMAAGAVFTGTGNIDSDPIFLSTTATSANFLALSSTSPCIDASGPDAALSDMNGRAYRDVVGLHCEAASSATCSVRDMGALEF